MTSITLATQSGIDFSLLHIVNPLLGPRGGFFILSTLVGREERVLRERGGGLLNIVKKMVSVLGKKKKVASKG